MAVREADLLARAQSGGADAFEELLAPHRQALYRYSLRLCDDTEAARDLLQQTVFAAYRGIKLFRGGSLLSTWLIQIARNFWLARRRKELTAPDRMALLRAARSSPFDEQPQPDAWLHTKEISLILRDAIQRLSADHREAVVLYDVRGLSMADAATAAGVNRGALKSRLHRARAELRADLTESHGRAALLGER